MFGKSLMSKSSKNKISVDSAFSNTLYGKNENLETPEINRKLSKSKKNPVLIVYHY